MAIEHTHLDWNPRNAHIGSNSDLDHGPYLDVLNAIVHASGLNGPWVAHWVSLNSAKTSRRVRVIYRRDSTFIYSIGYPHNGDPKRIVYAVDLPAQPPEWQSGQVIDRVMEATGYIDILLQGKKLRSLDPALIPKLSPYTFDYQRRWVGDAERTKEIERGFTPIEQIASKTTQLINPKRNLERIVSIWRGSFVKTRLCDDSWWIWSGHLALGVENVPSWSHATILHALNVLWNSGTLQKCTVRTPDGANKYYFRPNIGGYPLDISSDILALCIALEDGDASFITNMDEKEILLGIEWLSTNKLLTILPSGSFTLHPRELILEIGSPVCSATYRMGGTTSGEDIVRYLNELFPGMCFAKQLTMRTELEALRKQDERDRKRLRLYQKLAASCQNRIDTNRRQVGKLTKSLLFTK